MSGGSLVVVGTGISVGHLTAEARAFLCSAEKVLYAIADATTERLILKLNPNAESLFKYYGEGKQRKETYEEMVERIMQCVREGQAVCVAFYGHPGVFVYASHKAIQLAREEGFPARMLPAVSSIDCLFCDLGVDPSIGCQIFEASDVMIRKRKIDTSGHIIILQVSALGDFSYSFNGFDARNVPSLGEYLSQHYPLDFGIKLYEASQFRVCDPKIREITIGDLVADKIRGLYTLYIPPLDRAPVHLNMLDKYNLRSILKGFRLIPLNSQPDDDVKPSSDS